MCFLFFSGGMDLRQIMIAGTGSGTGKTTISTGIMRALKRRGHEVIPFKVGPDYIDTGFHRAATGVSSVNLDLWMAGEAHTRFLYAHHMEKGDFAVVEGVMGLYDGTGDEKGTGSTAHTAKILNLPVILIIDGEKTGSSAAAVVLGFREYDREVNLAGVIVNRVSSESHYTLIREAIEKRTGIPCLGYVPLEQEMHLPSRHLGLVPENETQDADVVLKRAASLIEKHLNLDALERIAVSGGSGAKEKDPRSALKNIGAGLRIGLAEDDAFSFYYKDNLELLEYMGMEIIPFSPLKDEALPKELDGIYLGGGFPEVHAKRLSSNSTFRKSLYEAMEEGMPVYGECGGYMYLTQGILDGEGVFHDMVGFLEGHCEMTRKLQRFGYAEMTAENGAAFRGHEFHHSRWIGPDAVKHALSLNKPDHMKSMLNWTCGQRRKNVQGAYAHIHFYSNLHAVGDIAQLLVKRKESKYGEISINDKK